MVYKHKSPNQSIQRTGKWQWFSKNVYLVGLHYAAADASRWGKSLGSENLWGQASKLKS